MPKPVYKLLQTFYQRCGWPIIQQASGFVGVGPSDGDVTGLQFALITNRGPAGDALECFD